MDKKELVTDQYGRREARVEQNANGFFWGLDNWMHTANADVMLRFKDGKFEVRKTLSRGEWGVTQDDAGRIYRNTNESILHADLVPTPYFMRNPNLLRTRGSYERLSMPDNDLNSVWPVRPNPGLNRGYQAGVRRADGTLARYTAACSPVVYRGDRLPADIYGNVFVADPAGNLVSRITLRNNILHDSYNNDILKINNGAGQITVEGNIFYNQTGSDEHMDVNSVTDVVIQDNIFLNDFAGSGRANVLCPMVVI